LAGWCSWLSRMLNTHKVLGSSPSLVISFCIIFFLTLFYPPSIFQPCYSVQHT
ncbi:hypothetical protein BDV26DRAFT_257018, partial [Aspergillus bertholletiae]